MHAGIMTTHYPHRKRKRGRYLTGWLAAALWLLYFLSLLQTRMPPTQTATIVHRELLQGDATLQGPPRILMGIFTRDDEDGKEQRQRYRRLFKDEPRICPIQDDVCQVHYTFVVGANPNAPSQRTDGDLLLSPSSLLSPHSPDINNDDVTRLNIR